ncbi:response regulator transcription factor [Rubrivirga sp. S365]|uniref:Response regulator transcription factor n=1 Tax=Rubrivirga litoralis TaxID=3075598 RepID=A0ABU3BP98_9BACT|nr:MULTISPECIES: response regulator transcription factor [unclassified Rubrivirga]MDT0631105.1 response regulator transcription factor [Rubrivirga sp. F394]MDT7855382.1 response regulator transcription factor [Rubrivirga sp. S365]
MPTDAPRDGSAVTVVLADDHPAFRAGIRGALEKGGAVEVVGEAADGDEALKLVGRLRPDVLLLDMNMPAVTGLDVAEALQTDPDAPRVLALSAYNDSATIHGLLDAGVAGYITKDQHPAAVREAVLAVHRGEGRWFVPIPKRPETLSPLTGREHEVLVAMARGLDNAEIGDRLRIAENTVRNHLAAVYSKLGVGSAREAVAWAWENGLVRA